MVVEEEEEAVVHHYHLDHLSEYLVLEKRLVIVLVIVLVPMLETRLAIVLVPVWEIELVPVCCINKYDVYGHIEQVLRV